jgi:hypothetical protein
LGLFGAAIGSVGLLVVSLAYGLPLMALMIPFLIGLCGPLLVLTSLHPGIVVEQDGLRLTPLVWKSSFVRWADLERLTEHTLLKPPPPQRRSAGKRRVEIQSGVMIIARRGALPWHYRIVGLMAGSGFRPTFAIASHAHVGYEALYKELQRRMRQPEQNR